ncbi:MAG: YqgE/AlgH family protein, partial [Candidatus Kuenenia stuttgartiensis]|nr:YqgE/AlgH family protein [Candidatus Kuenenia stuttgartiensis]
MQSVNLTHHFLIAMPNMADPNFARSLTYICEHNEQGALGLVVNRPIDMTLGGLFEQVDIALDDPRWVSLPVYFGGPVQ